MDALLKTRRKYFNKVQMILFLHLFLISFKSEKKRERVINKLVPDKETDIAIPCAIVKLRSRSVLGPKGVL